MLLLLATLLTAWAQDDDVDPLDVGAIRQDDVMVVQTMLYPKAGRTEIGMVAGWMAFDPYLVTPNAQLSFEMHQSEMMSFGVVLGGGYGLKTPQHQELLTRHGVAPNAYRYLGSALAGVGWSPVYAKMNLGGDRILHHDLFVTGRGGLTVEQSVIPEGGLAFAPTVSGSVGARIFLGDRSNLRLELRDDLLLERRKLTESTHLKQNVNVMVGLTMLSPLESNR